MRIHILGGVGMMTTPLAIELQQQGHNVSVSDQNKIYPPFDKIIHNANISFNQTPIDDKVDLYIIGSAYKNNPRTLAEYEQIKKNNFPYISSTQYLSDHLIKNKSILVAGSYGKTTISAMLSWIFINLKMSPNYFFGGLSVDGISSLKISESPWSIVEADESINGLDTQAKFLYYPAKYLILTSAQWEHKESYPTALHNHQAFKKLVSTVPSDGVIVYNQNDSEILKLLPFCKAKTVPYKNFNFKTNLIGKHNQENITAALTLCNALGFDINQIIPFVTEFHGIKRRLEIISTAQNITIIDDFAQSSLRVLSAIEAIHHTYPKSPIKIYFEPNASFLQNIASLNGFGTAFAHCQEVIFSRLKFNRAQSSHRVTANSFAQEIGSKFKYIPINDQIHDYFIQTLVPGDILIHFSSGGLDGLTNLYSIVSHLDSKTL